MKKTWAKTEKISVKAIKGDSLWGYLFIMPVFLGFVIFALMPILLSMYYSFTKYNLYSPPQFIGLQNYADLLKDELVGKTFFNTFYAALGIPFVIILSFLTAALLCRKIKGISFFRTMFYIPMVCSAVAVSLMWRWIFNSEYGLLNYFLSLIGINGPNWLSSTQWAMPAMIIQGIWGGLGGNIILYIASIKNVPQSLYESADIDGATAWQKLIKITLPSVSPTTFFIFVMSCIGAMQDFARFLVMTGGGPDYSTTTAVYYLYLNAFRYMKMGYASSLAWVVGMIVIIITIINFKLSDKWVNYD